MAFTSDNQATKVWVQELADPAIKSLELPADPTLTLGEKRNAAIAASHGDIWCTWDDDDWHHPARLEAQHNALQSSDMKSVSLSSVILYDSVSSHAYLSASRYAWEQTVMCERSFIENSDVFRFSPQDRGEDSALLYQLKNHHLLLTLSKPELYIYVYHSANTFHREHWEVNLLPWAKQLQPSSSYTISQILENGLNMKEASVLDQIAETELRG